MYRRFETLPSIFIGGVTSSLRSRSYQGSSIHVERLDLHLGQAKEGTLLKLCKMLVQTALYYMKIWFY